MDGVIVDSEPLHYDSEKYALAKFGLDFPRDVHKQYIGFASELRFWEELVTLFKADIPIEKLMEYKKEYFYSHLDEIIIIEAARMLLERAKAKGIAIGLASSSGVFMIETILNRFGLKRYFSVIQSGEEVKFGKPHPDIFLKTAERLRINPESCIVIEDSLNGVKSGKSAGMTVIAVPNEYTRVLDFSIADHVLKTLDEFYSLGLMEV
jgi:HAD superfamily hydrolase (TIGR01509 family)